MRSRGERLRPPVDAPGPDSAPGPAATAGGSPGSPRTCGAADGERGAVWRWAQRRNPQTSSHLLFLTSLSGCHDDGPLYRGWMGTGQLGTARQTGATGNPGNPLARHRMAQPRPTPSIFWLHPAAVQWMLGPQKPPPAQPELQNTSRHPKHGGESPNTEETPLPAQSPVIICTQ